MDRRDLSQRVSQAKVACRVLVFSGAAGTAPRRCGRIFVRRRLRHRINVVHAGPSSIEALLTTNEEMLLRGLARKRLGATLADALCRRLRAITARLAALDRATNLVHGDLGGRNILVAPADNGNWRVSGLIDWEAAFSGSALWDVGSLFRYARRYSEDFRQRFERSYRDAGGSLPEDWRRTARLLDSTRMVATLERGTGSAYRLCGVP